MPMVMLTLLAHSIVPVAMDQHLDLVAQFVVFQVMLRPSAVEGLFFLSINHIVVPVSTGLLSLLALFVVEAKPLYKWTLLSMASTLSRPISLRLIS
jgi:hypothetical protein